MVDFMSGPWAKGETARIWEYSLPPPVIQMGSRRWKDRV